MTIPVPIVTSLIAASTAILIAVVGALFNIYSRLGKLEEGQKTLAAEIRASRERSDMQFAAAEAHIAAVEKRTIAHIAAVEKRTIAHIAAVEERLITRIEAVEERAIAREAAAEERVIARIAAVEERAIARIEAVEERAIARIEAAEERAIARHNELLAEMRLWRHHRHDEDGMIFFRVPE